MSRSLILLALCLMATMGQQPVTRSVGFGGYADTRAMAADWEIGGGTWTPTGDTLVAESVTDRTFASFVAVPVAAPIEVSATVTVTARRNPQSYVTGGISVFLDSGSFWQLALVEGPDGRRYAELVEMAAGSWQAQREGPTKLEPAQFEGQFAGWDYAKPYRLTLRVDDHEVRGTVADAATGQLVTTLRYLWGEAQGVKEGRPALTVLGLQTTFAQLAVTTTPPSEDDSPVEIRRGSLGAVALLDDPSGALDRATIDALDAALTAGGFGVTRLNFARLADPAVLEPRRVDALVIANSRAFPPAARDSLLRFLRGGGDLVLLGGPAFREPLWPVGEGWATGAELRERADQTPDQVTLFDFEATTPVGWERLTNNQPSGSAVSLEPGPHGRAAKFEVRELKGWDNLQAAFPYQQAGDANALTIWLKADAATPQVALELREEDGSRWITAVDVTPEWRRYVIPDWRFEYWRDSQSAGRGAEGDFVKLPQARFINVGQAFSHTGDLPGDHTLWFDQIGLAKVDLPRVTNAAPVDLPVFSDYEVYRLDGPTAAVARADQDVVPATRLPLNASGWSAIGFTFPNESQYQSLLDAVDEHGRSQGSALGMVVNYRGRYRDSVWLLSGIADQAFYRSPGFASTLTAALERAVTPALADALRDELRQPLPELALTTAPPHRGHIQKSADGKHLVYPGGRRFFMIGCNYVGHFNRCGGRMWSDTYYDPRVVEEDFKLAHDAGLNVMRYWLQSTIDQDLRKGDLRKVTAIRECARKYGVYLLLDLPGTGYASEAEMVASHRAIAQAFADEPMVLGYDLRNEPYVTTLGGVRYEGEPVPIQSRDLRQVYPGRIDDAQLKAWIAERPYWLHLPGWLQGDEAERVAAAWTLWGQFTRETQLANSTLAGLGAEVPAKGWEALVDAVNTSLDRWLQVQIDAIREVDPNHLITVGHNTALTILPANARLDFVSEHIYGRPTSHANVVENMTTLDRLAARWPDKPITLGEFGYSNGIKLPDGYLDEQTSAVGEMAHYLYALANGYDGAMKWMLCDWPLEVMKRYGDWDRGLETRIYEERFGLYSYDGTPGGRPKPIVWALKWLQDDQRTAPGRYAVLTEEALAGRIEVYPAENRIGLGYVYHGVDAIVVGDSSYADGRMRFTAETPRNVMLRWGVGYFIVMACDDTTVQLNVEPAKVTGKVAGQKQEGQWLSLDLLAGETVYLTFL